MTTEAMQAVLDEYRNGANQFFFNPLYGKQFAYTDGVKELCEAGQCFWLLDIIGTEPAPLLRKLYRSTGEVSCLINVKAAGGKCDVRMTTDDHKPPEWERHIDFTTLPDIDFVLEMGIDDDGTQMRATLILLSEH